MSDDTRKRFPEGRVPEFRMPPLPSIEIPAPNFPDIEIVDKSASGLIEALDRLVTQWKEELPDAQPTIYAILANGVTIEARDFSDAGHHGIGIRGRLLSDGSECLVLVHQSGLQLLCRIVKTESPQQRYPIGFHYSGKADQSG